MRKLALIVGLVFGLCGTAQAHSVLGHIRALHLPLLETTHLVTPAGQPVRGPWQRWIDESKISTYHGTEILDLNRSDTHLACGDGPTACSSPTYSAPDYQCPFSACPPSGMAETWIVPVDRMSDQAALYYEHGHILDFMVATDADRAAFMRIWRLSGTVADWWKGENQFTGDGAWPPGELWSAAYELCAEGASDLDSIQVVQHRERIGRWAVTAQRESCALFRHL